MKSKGFTFEEIEKLFEDWDEDCRSWLGHYPGYTEDISSRGRRVNEGVEAVIHLSDTPCWIEEFWGEDVRCIVKMRGWKYYYEMEQHLPGFCPFLIYGDF